MMRKIIGLSLIGFVLSGCATNSGYEVYYTPNPQATPEVIAAKRASPPPETPQLDRADSDKIEETLSQYEKRGFSVIGYSQFNSGQEETDESALMQGKSVGADLVIVLTPKHTGTVTTSIPLTTPTTSTSYTTANATAYGRGGAINVYGNAQTTTYGSQTTYFPVTVSRADYGAVYLVKQRFSLGAYYRDLNDVERQTFETNQGVVVVSVVDDTPAFKADVLSGDMIVSIDGERVSSQTHFEKLLDSKRGMRVKIELKRKGRFIEKTIQLDK